MTEKSSVLFLCRCLRASSRNASTSEGVPIMRITCNFGSPAISGGAIKILRKNCFEFVNEERYITHTAELISELCENTPQNQLELREMYYQIKYSPGILHIMPQDRGAIVLWTRLPIGHRTMMSTIWSLPQQY